MQAPAQERIEAFGPTRDGLTVKLLMMLGGDEPREDGEAAVFDYEIMVAAAERDAAHFRRRGVAVSRLHSPAPAVRER